MNDPMPSEFATHLREMASHRRVIAAVAAAVAVLALVVGLTRPATYEAEATVRVSLAESTGDDGAITDFHAGSLAALATADRVVADAIDISGDDRSASDVRDALSAELGDSRGFVVLTASAPSATEAARLANALARSLAAEARRDPAAKSVAMRVTLVSAARSADASPTATAGRAVGGAIALALLAAIVAGEGLIALRLLRGRLSPVDPAADLSRLVGAPVLDLRGGAGSADEFAFYQEHLRPRRLVTVIEMGTPASNDVATSFVRIAEEAHRRVLFLDADAEPASPGRRRVDGVREQLVGASADQAIVSAGRRSSIDELLRVAHAFPHAVVLSVDAGCEVRRVRALLELLRPVEVTVVAGVVR